MESSSTDRERYLRIETELKVLAHASRLELLEQLRSPKTLDEIRLVPGAAQSGASPDRVVSRQAVQHHIEALTQLGIVKTRKGERPGKRALQEYILDPTRVFAVVEELRRVLAIRAQETAPLTRTVGVHAGATPYWEPGPKLVLAHGATEGKAFPLKRSLLSRKRGWIVGRRKECHVSLDYDPFVSSENCEILPGDNGLRLLDLRSALNGTYLNWERLAPGAEAPLAPGDVIGVGRSLLVYRDR